MKPFHCFKIIAAFWRLLIANFNCDFNLNLIPEDGLSSLIFKRMFQFWCLSIIFVLPDNKLMRLHIKLEPLSMLREDDGVIK